MERFPERVTLFEDGVYRWHYDMDMWRNRYMFKLLMKIMAIICSAIALAIVIALGPGDRLPVYAGYAALGVAGMMLLAALIYALVAAVMRGRYRLRYEMDETAVALVRTEKTQGALAVMSTLASIAGMPSYRTGEGFRAGSTLDAIGAVGTTRFSTVRRVRQCPDYDVLELREFFGMNQIYVNREDYPFLRDFILAHVREKARD